MVRSLQKEGTDVLNDFRYGPKKIQKDGSSSRFQTLLQKRADWHHFQRMMISAV